MDINELLSLKKGDMIRLSDENWVVLDCPVGPVEPYGACDGLFLIKVAHEGRHGYTTPIVLPSSIIEAL